MRALSPWLADAHLFPVTSHNKERVLWCPVLFFCGQQASRIRVPLFWPCAKSLQSCPTLETLWTIYSLPGPFLHGLLFFFFFLVKRVIYLFIFSFIFISWRLITLQYCSAFCHTLTWISHGFTCVPHPDPPSRFPLYRIPLGFPSAPGQSICLMHLGFFRQEYWSGCHALL